MQYAIIPSNPPMESIVEKFHKLALRFLVPFEPDEAYPIIVEEAVKVLDALYASVILEQQGYLVRIFSSSPVAFKTTNRNRGFTYRAFKEKKVIVVDISVTRKVHPELAGLGVKTTIFIPLSYRGNSIGVLTVNSARPRSQYNNQSDILKLLGSMASLVIRKAQMHIETKKALELRDLFISMAAHELRTPLTTISVYSQLLKKRVGKSKDKTAIRWSDELTWEIYRLTQLVNELLAVNRIKTGEFHYILRECSLREVLSRAITNFQFSHPDRKLVFTDKIGTNKDIIVGDFDKLLQVFINLLENAAKFSRKEILLTAIASKPCYNIEVKDQGKGIAKEDLGRVFEGYYRGKNNQIEGMGLGLFLANNIVTKHRGTISVQSKVDKGTTIRVKLPMSTL